MAKKKRGRRRLDPDGAETFSVRMPKGMIEQIDMYMQKEMLPDRASSIRRLLQERLNEYMAEKEGE